jgi:hypothetical protein
MRLAVRTGEAITTEGAESAGRIREANPFTGRVRFRVLRVADDIEPFKRGGG